MAQISLLDCTLRDGAYITDSRFGVAAMRGIIRKMQEAHVEIVECGWLKNKEHEEGSSFFHVPEDALAYISQKEENCCLTAMIDWDRYDDSILPECDGRSIDAIRVVFPHGKHGEAMKIGERIRAKGYRVLFQAANTLAYSEEELGKLAEDMNAFAPVALSVVDTFGAMFFEDLDRILAVLDRKLDKGIRLGIHAHNNQQLAFALTVHFIERLIQGERDIIVDATLSGMGRGAGNATTELVCSYLNRYHHGNYDMNAVMDAIDTYIDGFRERFFWGYSTAYFIAGMYQCHVNNIAYLQNNHRTNARDMRSIIESLSSEERRHYDYDLLERRYMENQARFVDDGLACEKLRDRIQERKVLLIAPGKSVQIKREEIKTFIEKERPLVIAVNAISEGYDYDLLFFTNTVRYEYAEASYSRKFAQTPKILLSSIKTKAEEDEYILNFDEVVKRGWEHFDNAVILCLRMLNKLNAHEVYIAGFDGFKTKYNESYCDVNLPTLNPGNKWEELNEEITDMYLDVKHSTEKQMKIRFVTESIFDR